MNRNPFIVLLVLIVAARVINTNVSAQSNPLITSIAWSPDGSKIAIGGGLEVCDPDDSTPFDVKIVDAQTQQNLQTLTGFNCRITSIEWSPDGTKIAVSSGDTFGLKVWDSATGRLLAITHLGGQGIADIKWRPIDDQLAAAYVSHAIAFMDAMTGEGIKELRSPIGGTDLDWSPDGSKLISGSGFDDVVYVGDIATSQEIMQLTGNTYGVTDVDWSPDGKKIASGGGDRTVRIWDSLTGESLFTLFGHDEVVADIQWRPGFNQIASADSAGEIIIWDVNNGRQIEQFQAARRVYDVEWSPDGTQLVYADSDSGLKFVSPSLEYQTAPFPLPAFLSVATPASWLILGLLTQILN